MRRIGLCLCCVGLLVGCAQATRQPVATPTIVFLTRDSCVNTATMRGRLDDALRSLGRPVAYQVVDADMLLEADPRRGYSTPTVLVDDRDLFGMGEQDTGPADVTPVLGRSSVG